MARKIPSTMLLVMCKKRGDRQKQETPLYRLICLQCMVVRWPIWMTTGSCTMTTARWGGGHAFRYDLNFKVEPTVTPAAWIIGTLAVAELTGTSWRVPSLLIISKKLENITISDWRRNYVLQATWATEAIWSITRVGNRSRDFKLCSMINDDEWARLMRRAKLKTDSNTSGLNNLSACNCRASGNGCHGISCALSLSSMSKLLVGAQALKQGHR